MCHSKTLAPAGVRPITHGLWMTVARETKQHLDRDYSGLISWTATIKDRAAHTGFAAEEKEHKSQMTNSE